MQPVWNRGFNSTNNQRSRATSEPSAPEGPAQQFEEYDTSRLQVPETYSPSFSPQQHRVSPTSAPRIRSTSSLDTAVPPLLTDLPPGHTPTRSFSASQVPSDVDWSLVSTSNFLDSKFLPPAPGLDQQQEASQSGQASTNPHQNQESPDEMSTYAFSASPASMHGHYSPYDSPPPMSFMDYNPVQLPDLHVDASSSMGHPMGPTSHGQGYSASPRIPMEKDIQIAHRRHQEHQVRRLSKLRRRQEGRSHIGPLDTGAHQPKFDMRSHVPAQSLETINTGAPAPQSLLRQSSQDSSSAGEPFGYPLQDPGQNMQYGMPPLGMSHGQVSLGPSESMYQPHSQIRAMSEVMDRSSSLPPHDMQPQGRGISSSRSDDQVRVINSRPKPRCWDHGCNGRQFSTFSNLLRHQREKSGTASKSYCPRCGAEFTRTTARNGHMAHDKCKPRKDS